MNKISKPYNIIVMFEAKPGMEQALHDHLQAIVKIALAQSGCLYHTLHQSRDNPARFMFYEHWKTEVDHEQHVARKEVQAWRQQLSKFLAKDYEVSFWSAE